MIPFLSFDYQDNLYRDELIETFADVLDAKWYILGQRLENFEKAYAVFNKVNYSVGVANGLDALIICLKVLGIGEGDEVIVPSNTYIASWLAVSAVGAKPIPVEPNKDTYNIDPDLIEKAITKKTKAIMPVHLYGQACAMDRIMNIAKKNKIYVVEDNAQAHGATYSGTLTGAFGDINATSFYPGKNLGALGDAGGITTDSEQLAKHAKIFRNYGSQQKYHNLIKGINSRLDELQAAILNVKLKYLTQSNEERIKIAQIYNKELALDGIKLPLTHPQASHVYHLYVIRSNSRDKLQKHLSDDGIQTLIHYPIPPHMQQAYADMQLKKGSFPIAEEIAETCLSLPIYPGMTEDAVAQVVSSIKKIYA